MELGDGALGLWIPMLIPVEYLGDADVCGYGYGCECEIGLWREFATFDGEECFQQKPGTTMMKS